MKKILITLISIIGISAFPTTTAQAMTIYTSLPDEDDQYYQPYWSSLQKFNQDLHSNATSDDEFVTLNSYDKSNSSYHYPDIWLRDVAPVITSKMVKFKYQPRYLKRTDAKYLNRRFNNFIRGKFYYTHSDLILDGGNVQWNGSDTIILTKQVLGANPDWSKRQIIDHLKKKLQVKKVILITKEPGDVLGHSDGMVKFISKHKIFINDFSYEPNFLQKIKQEILQVDPKMKFVVLPSSYTDVGQYDDQIASARGLYINMLETDDKIYFPQYGLANDRKAMKLVADNTDKQVIPIDVSKISTLGGSVHCLTWEVLNKFTK